MGKESNLSLKNETQVTELFNSSQESNVLRYLNTKFTIELKNMASVVGK